MIDELDKLFISNKELKKDVLFKILNGRVKITENKDILMIGDFSQQEKILLYLLSKKVLFIKKLGEKDSAGPKEISIKTGIPEGTAKVSVINLSKKGFLIKTKKREYSVPNFALNNIKDFFEKEWMKKK